jgi:hypothetical protein
MRILGWGALALTILVPGASRATTILAQSWEEMTAKSDLIARGTAGASEAHWDPAHRRIFTYTEIRLDEEIKGHAGSMILVRSPGGVAEGLGQRVEGSPTFHSGEAVVLFLERAPDEPGVLQVAGLAAGKVTLAPSKLAGVRATRDLRGISQYRLGTGERTSRIEGSEIEDLGPAKAFIERIRAAARKAALR